LIQAAILQETGGSSSIPFLTTKFQLRMHPQLSSAAIAHEFLLPDMVSMAAAQPKTKV